MIDCIHYQNHTCRSCQWLEMPYVEQLEEKQQHLKQQIGELDCSQTQWFEPYSSASVGFRNKAKMVVSGSVERPILGIINDYDNPQSAVDLTDCPIYPARFSAVFDVLKDLSHAQDWFPITLLNKKGN